MFLPRGTEERWKSFHDGRSLGRVLNPGILNVIQKCNPTRLGFSSREEFFRIHLGQYVDPFTLWETMNFGFP